jgi:subtilase family protein
MDSNLPLISDNAYRTLFVAPRIADQERRSGGGDTNLDVHAINRARDRFQQDLSQILMRMTSPGFGSQAFDLARLKLKGGSIAKSNRPRKVFGVDTCPILGDWGESGEMLVLVHPEGIKRLSERVSRLSERDAKNLMNVESITSVDSRSRLSRTVQRSLQREILQNGRARIKLRALHLDLWGSISEEEVSARLSEITGEGQHPYLRFNQVGLYGVTIRSMEAIEQIAQMWFVTSISVMPTYIQTDMLLAATSLERVELDTSVDIDQLRTVLIFDGGVDQDGPLGPLVSYSERFEDDEFLDLKHGTGVAAQAVRRADSTGNVLIPRARLIDVRGVPKRGSGRVLTEDILVERLEYCAGRYGRIAGEWNLSLAAEPGPQPETFSDIAMYLDNLHKRYGIVFFVSPGNCAPRAWPPSGETEDFVAAPGDAVCALTVGSSVQDDTTPNFPTPAGAPSPFSPRGPVAYSVAKPDIMAPGGNVAGKREMGVPILGPDGQWTAGLGTSYSTPTVAGAGAELMAFLTSGGIVEHYRQEGFADVNLGVIMRALLSHHAHLVEVGVLLGNAPVDSYRGFGELPSLEEMLLDPSWRNTSVIYTRLRPKVSMVLDRYPFPGSLSNGKLYWGHAVVTMASDPLLNPAFPKEYIRSNVDVHFGVMQTKEKVIKNEDGSETRKSVLQLCSQIHDTFADKVQATHKNEPRLILEEHKWSPVKKFQSEPMFKCTGEFWRLKAELLLRDIESDALDADPTLADELSVDVAIVVTLDDPMKQAPVNQEIFTGWQSRNQVAASIQMRPRLPLKW